MRDFLLRAKPEEQQLLAVQQTFMLAILLSIAPVLAAPSDSKLGVRPASAAALSNAPADSTFIHELRPKNADSLKAKVLQLDQVIEKNTTIAKNYATRGDCYNTLGEHGRALSDYDHAIKLEPKKQDWYVGRARVYFRLLRPIDAVKDLTKALEIGPATGQIYLDRASGYELMHDYSKALVDANKAVGIVPNNCQAYILRASSNSRLGNMEECIADCTAALKLAPQKAEVYYMRGKAYAQLQKKDLADADFEQALKLGLP